MAFISFVLLDFLGGFGRSHGLFYLRFKDKFGGSATSTALVTSIAAFVRLSTGKCRLRSHIFGHFRQHS